MNPLIRLFIALTVAGLATLLVPISASPVLVFDHDGNLFFEGRNTGTIFKFAPDGTKSTFATGANGAAINGDLAIDAAGNLFACANSNTILKFTPDGTRSTFATEVGTNWPSALTVDAGDNLFVGSRGAILKFAPDGTKSTFATGIEPYGLAFDQSGNLFAADMHGENGHLVGAIVKFRPNGNKSTFLPDLQAYALAFDRSGNLFVAVPDAILKFTPDGNKSTFASNIDASEGLAFDAAGNLFGCDGNNRISKFAPDGTKSAFNKGRHQVGAGVEEEDDSADGLPENYAKNYLIASKTVSRDEKFAVIYPTQDEQDFPGGANYVVSLKPFAILGKLNTKWPYFKNESHGGLSADWSDDGSVALITLDGKWGPHDIFLVEFKSGKVSRTTNLTAKMHDALVSDYRKAKAVRYNDYFDFIFEFEGDPLCEFDGSQRVRINAFATTDPKGGGDERVWDGRLKATWDVAQAKFTSQKVTRVFAGIRKHED